MNIGACRSHRFEYAIEDALRHQLPKILELAQRQPLSHWVFLTDDQDQVAGLQTAWHFVNGTTLTLKVMLGLPPTVQVDLLAADDILGRLRIETQRRQLAGYEELGKLAGELAMQSGRDPLAVPVRTISLPDLRDRTMAELDLMLTHKLS